MEELTRKQQEFVKEYVSNGQNGVKAALEVYDTTDYSTAGNIASENLNKPKIEAAIKSIAEMISTEKIAQRLNEGLDATKWDERGGELTDYATRHKYVDTALKVKDLYPIKKTDITSDGEKIDFRIINYDAGE